MKSAYQKLQPKLDLASKISLVLTGFVLPLSVTGIAIFFNLTVVLSLLAGNFKSKIKSLRGNWVLIIALFILFLLLLSMTYSTAPWPDQLTAWQKYSKLLYLLFFMPLFADYQWRRIGINAFLAAMVVTLITSFLKMAGWLHFGNGGLGSLFANHIITGFLMAYAAFIVVHRCFEKNALRWLWLVLFLLISYHIFFMNEGRTGYVVFAALFVLFLYQKFRWKGLLAALIAAPLLLGGLFMVSNTFKQRIEIISQDFNRYHQQQLEYNSIGLRFVFIKNSLTLIKEHPWVGTGVGSFRSDYGRQFPPAPGFANMTHPQLDYLLLAVQLGLIGLAVYLWLFYTEWRASGLLPADLKNLAQGMIVAFMVGGLCDSFLFLAIPGYFFIYFSALFFANRLIKTQ